VLIATRKNNMEVVKILIKHKAKINVMNNKGLTPLIYHVKKKNLKNVEDLLNLGADPNMTDK